MTDPAGAGWFVAEVIARRRLTPTAAALTLRVPGWPGHLAGQHLDVRLTAPDGYQAARSYSIASAPGSGTLLELAVERFDEGEVSPYLAEFAEPGDQLEIRGPIGSWFVWRDDQVEPVQLIAGGSGVAPLLAMAREHRRAASGAAMRLLYSVRSPDSVYEEGELAELAESGIRVDLAYTRYAPLEWTGEVGRLDATRLEALTLPAVTRDPTDALAPPSPTVYVCGPTGFVEHVASTLVALGHDPNRIRTERFGAS